MLLLLASTIWLYTYKQGYKKISPGQDGIFDALAANCTFPTAAKGKYTAFGSSFNLKLLLERS